jgi:group I intron endonuclease
VNKQKNYCVYCHTSPSGKKYIGITCQKPSQRWHRGEGYVQHRYFYNAIKKYGWNNIKHEILYENLSREEACSKEVELIKKYRSNETEYGYNISKGGDSGYAGCKWTEERKEKARQFMVGKKFALGYKQTEETKRNMSIAQKKRVYPPLTEEQKAISIRNLPNPMFGADNPASRSIICIETGIVYPTIKEASKQLGLRSAHICSVCKGNRNHTGGYHFKYYDLAEKVTEVAREVFKS